MDPYLEQRYSAKLRTWNKDTLQNSVLGTKVWVQKRSVLWADSVLGTKNSVLGTKIWVQNASVLFKSFKFLPKEVQIPIKKKRPKNVNNFFECTFSGWLPVEQRPGFPNGRQPRPEPRRIKRMEKDFPYLFLGIILFFPMPIAISLFSFCPTGKKNATLHGWSGE